MGNLDARFKNQIFRKDNPIIIAANRHQAKFIGIRIPFDANGYMPGQVLAANPVASGGDGLYYKWSALLPAAQGGGPVSGTLTANCVLFDQATNYDQFADGDGLAGVSGATLVRGLIAAEVYTNNLVDYTASAKTGLGSKDYVDAGGVAITKF